MKKNIVIAGGSKGIGFELTHQIKSDSRQVFVLSRQRDELEENERITHIPVDFHENPLPELKLPDEIHGIVYCPGTINLKSFRSLSVKDFVDDYETNVLGAVKLLQHCLPNLKRASQESPTSVVLFSTVAVSQGMPMHSSIAAAKGAVEALTRSLAAEWAPNIRVNCIAPALTETPLASRFFRSEESRQTMAKKYPLGRTGRPQDVASMARFLLNPESSWMTGQVIGIDGGMSSVGKG